MLRTTKWYGGSIIAIFYSKTTLAGVCEATLRVELLAERPSFGKNFQPGRHYVIMCVEIIDRNFTYYC
jgi:hypothetical protein